ncbi:MAG: hypothetical protein ACLPSW_26240, partial [Roseiarcus sp.]
ASPGRASRTSAAGAGCAGVAEARGGRRWHEAPDEGLAALHRVAKTLTLALSREAGEGTRYGRLLFLEKQNPC